MGFIGSFPKTYYFASLPLGLEKGSGLPQVPPVRSCITGNKTRTATYHVKINSLGLVMNGPIYQGVSVLWGRTTSLENLEKCEKSG